ncbi:MAG: DUF3261 domain-containing protein [Nevskia sp.]|nr:DUF3261 domain-containing protein [Nevskia sp.]
MQTGRRRKLNTGLSRPRRLLPVLGLAALLSACAAAPPSAEITQPPPQHPPLLPPASVDAPHQAEQVMRGAFGTRDFTLRCVVRATPAQIFVVGLTATGQRAFSVSWDGTAWDTRSAPMVPDSLRPDLLIADVQLALWPLPALQAAYAPAGWEVSEPGGGVRRLRQGGRIVAEVHYADPHPWNGRYWISNFRYSYSLEIEPAPAAAGAQ